MDDWDLRLPLFQAYVCRSWPWTFVLTTFSQKYKSYIDRRKFLQSVRLTNVITRWILRLGYQPKRDTVLERIYTTATSDKRIVQERE